MMDLLKEAYAIATRDLRSCYAEHGIFAGSHHFDDYWARDSFFSSLGATDLGDFDIVRKNLALFLKSLSPGGQIPLRVGRSSLGIALAYIGLKGRSRRPIYLSDKGGTVPVDQNSLFIISLHDYIMKSRDMSIAGKMHRVEYAMEWNFRMDSDNDLLIEEGHYANWADSLRKKGKVLYTNVCHCHALWCLSEIYRFLKEDRRSREYLELHDKVKKRINKVFWTGENYLDWIDGDRHYNYFSTDGNMLAVLWGIADRERSRHIEEASHIYEINEIPSRCVHPAYPVALVSSQTRLIGIADYHNGMSWLWLGCISAMAKERMGMKKDASNLLERIAGIIVEDQGIYEVYESSGEPVDRLLYKAEHPFAWSSGLFIAAYHQILKPGE